MEKATKNKIVLESVFQTFEPSYNGRTYLKELFDKHFHFLELKMKRNSLNKKIKKVKNVSTSF